MDFQLGQMSVSIPWVNRLMFRTRDTDGLLMYIKLVSSVAISIEVSYMLHLVFNTDSAHA